LQRLKRLYDSGKSKFLGFLVDLGMKDSKLN
jgi:hypothetical protein